MAGFGTMAPGMPTLAKPKIAKPKKMKKLSMPYRGVSQQHLGGPYQAPQAPTAPSAAPDEAGSDSVG